ncbi:AAA family ATPase, partial [Candidatus Peregrinibacteria bacterium]|nr:AAA family ATPase [Candidatus Peregrinibacteria bacterium]
MNEREKALLATFINAPYILNSSNISPNDFSSPDGKKITAGILKLSKNGRPIDPVLIAEETKLPIDKIGEIITGQLMIPKENISGHIAEMKINRLGEALFKEIKNQDSNLIKKGQVDVKKIVKILSEIKAIQRKKAAPVVETLSAFMGREYPKRNVFIDPIFGEQEIIMLHGRPKIGKSLLSLQIARHIANSENLFDFQVNKIERSILIMQSEISP